MLRAIQTILIAACLPLLLPPGFCPCWLEALHAQTDAGESHWSESVPQHSCHCHDDDLLAGLPANSNGSTPLEHDCCWLAIGNFDATPELASGNDFGELAVESNPPTPQNLHLHAPKSVSTTNFSQIHSSTPLYLLQSTLLI